MLNHNTSSIMLSFRTHSTVGHYLLVCYLLLRTIFCATHKLNTTAPDASEHSSLAVTFPDQPICQLPTTPVTAVSLKICDGAIDALHADYFQLRWTEARYTWSDVDSRCTILLKSDKIPPDRGSKLRTTDIADAVESILRNCVSNKRGFNAEEGPGGSLRLISDDEAEWRVWVVGRYAGRDLDSPPGSDIEQVNKER